MRYGVAAMVVAGWETASSVPVRSVIAPRRAGTIRSASCWVAAARLSVPALTTPSQAAFPAPMTSSPRKTAKSSPIRRSISFMSGRRRRAGARGGGRDRLGGGLGGLAGDGGDRPGEDPGRRVPARGHQLAGRLAGRLHPLRGQARVGVRAGGEVADVAGGRRHHALVGGGELDALARGEARDLCLEIGVDA